MYDTIQVFKKGKEGSNFNIKRKCFNKKTEIRHGNHKNNRYSLSRRTVKSAEIHMNFIESYEGVDSVFINFSIPKLIYGNNVDEFKIEDTELVVPSLLESLKDDVEIRFEDMELCRLDICRNIAFDQDVSSYFRLLNNHVQGNEGSFSTQFYPNESFLMFNGRRSLSLYDKKKESYRRNEYCTDNILRIEYRLKKANTIKQFFSLDRNVGLGELLTNSFYDITKNNLIEKVIELLRIDENTKLAEPDDTSLWELAKNNSTRGNIKTYLLLRLFCLEGLNAARIRSLARGTLTDANIYNSLKSLEKLQSQIGTSSNIDLKKFIHTVIKRIDNR